MGLRVMPHVFIFFKLKNERIKIKMLGKKVGDKGNVSNRQRRLLSVSNNPFPRDFQQAVIRVPSFGLISIMVLDIYYPRG